MGNVMQPIADLDKSPQYVNELSAIMDEFGPLYQAAYEAGYRSGREAAYRQGYEAGYSDGGKQDNSNSAAAAVPANPAEVRRRQRGLLGLPCTNCEGFFYSDEVQCPRCKTPRETNVRISRAFL